MGFSTVNMTKMETLCNENNYGTKRTMRTRKSITQNIMLYNGIADSISSFYNT